MSTTVLETIQPNKNISRGIQLVKDAQRATDMRAEARSSIRSMRTFIPLAAIVLWWLALLSALLFGPSGIDGPVIKLLEIGRASAGTSLALVIAAVLFPPVLDRYERPWYGKHAPPIVTIIGVLMAALDPVTRTILAVVGLPFLPFTGPMRLTQALSTARVDLFFGPCRVHASDILDDERVVHLLLPLIAEIEEWNQTAVVLNRLLSIAETVGPDLSPKEQETVEHHRQAGEQILLQIALAEKLLAEGPIGTGRAISSHAENPLPLIGERLSESREGIETLASEVRHLLSARDEVVGVLNRP